MDFIKITPTFSMILNPVGTAINNVSHAIGKSAKVVKSVGSSALSSAKGIAQTGISTIQTTSKVIKKVEQTGYNLFLVANEILDFADLDCTKNPQNSIDKSCQRLWKNSTPEFFQSITSMVDLLSQMGAQNDDKIREFVRNFLVKVGKKIKLDEKIADGFTKDLIAQTIKANLLIIAANLAEEASEQGSPFKNDLDIIGKILSIIQVSLNKVEQERAAIELLPKDQQDAKYNALFQSIASDILIRLFPKKSTDLQFFLPDNLPFVALIKVNSWERINKSFAQFLEQLYHQTQPLKDDWKNEFDQRSEFKTKDLLTVPSQLLNGFLQKKYPKLLNDLPEVIEKFLIKESIKPSQADQLSKAMFNNVVAYVERYFMERLLNNLLEFSKKNGKNNSIFESVIQHWKDEKILHTLLWALQNKKQNHSQISQAFQNLLKPFGLIEQQSFPLPDLLKQNSWPKITLFIKDQLPLLFSNSTQWNALQKLKKNQAKISSYLTDSSLTHLVDAQSKILTQQVITYCQKDPAIDKTLKDIFPFLSDNQRQSIRNQVNLFLNEKSIQNFVQKSLNAISFQVLINPYENYKQKTFNPANKNQPRQLTFIEWITKEITEGCETFAKGFSKGDLKLFNKAIRLKKASHSQNAAKAQQSIKEFDRLWPSIEPKMSQISTFLLKILIKESSDLPIPAKTQQHIFELLNNKLPKILFEELGENILHMFEINSLQGKVKKIRGGKLILRTSQILSSEIIKALRILLKKPLGKMPAGIKKKYPHLILSDKMESLITQNLNALLDKSNPIYDEVWKKIETYIQGILLKVSLKLSRLTKQDFQKVQTLVNETITKIDQLPNSTQLVILNDPANKDPKQIIVEDFINKIFSALGLEVPDDVPGIPHFLKAPVLTAMKEKTAQTMLKAFGFIQEISESKIKPNSNDKIFPTSKISQVALKATQFILDQTIEQLTLQREGKFQWEEAIVDPLKIWLKKQGKESSQLSAIAYKVLDKDILNDFAKRLSGLAASTTFQNDKKRLSQWLNPYMTNVINKGLTALLNNEARELTSLEIALAKIILPMMTRQLKAFNQISSKSAKGKPTKDKKDPKLKDDVDAIFNLLFPRGKDDVIKLLPDFPLPDNLIDDSIIIAKDFFVTQFPSILKHLFSKEKLMFLANEVIEMSLENLKEPLDKSPKKTPKKADATKKEIKDFDIQMGLFVLEVGNFLKLPVDLLKKLQGLTCSKKKNSELEEHLAEKIGMKVRQKIEGQTSWKKSIKYLLNRTTNKKPSTSLPNKDTKEIKPDVKIQGLEKELASKTYKFAFQNMGAKIKNKQNAFHNPVLKVIHNGLLQLCSFIILTVLTTILRLLKIEQWIVNRLYQFINFGTNQIASVLS